jgi:hypothetical protein
MKTVRIKSVARFSFLHGAPNRRSDALAIENTAPRTGDEKPHPAVIEANSY